MKGYHTITNKAEDEKGDLVTDSHSILARWRNQFSQLWNVHGDTQPSTSEFEMATEKLK